MASKVVTGSRVVFRVNGVKVAFANAVSLNENIEREPVDELDKLETTEHPAIAYRTDFSVDMFRVSGQSVKQLGLMPTLEGILEAGVLQAEFVDTATGNTLALLENVVLTTRSVNIPARGIARETLNFVATRLRDEAEA